jgi:hypothetical protein
VALWCPFWTFWWIWMVPKDSKGVTVRKGGRRLSEMARLCVEVLRLSCLITLHLLTCLAY